MPNQIQRAHCRLEGMKTKPPKKSTLKRQALARKNRKGGLKDVVVKVHKVPEEVKNMVFRHDRAQPTPFTDPQPKVSPAQQTASSTKKMSKSQSTAASRKRKVLPESQDADAGRLEKKQKTAKDISASNTVTPVSRKRKATSEPEDVEEVPADKKQKTDASLYDSNIEVPAPAQPYTAHFQIKPDGTQRISFLHLPAEIRNDVYHLAMSERLNINRRQTWGNEHPLQKTCRQIRTESNLLFHHDTRFQTNKQKYAYAFIKSRTREQRASLNSVRISVPNKARTDEHSLREIRRSLYGFKRTFGRKGLKDGVIQMELPVYNPDKDKFETHWPSFETIGFYETMEGRRRNAQGAWENIRVTVVRPTEESKA